MKLLHFLKFYNSLHFLDNSQLNIYLTTNTHFGLILFLSMSNLSIFETENVSILIENCYSHLLKIKIIFQDKR